MSIEKPRYVYCVVKSALLREKSGKVICSVPFANPFRVIEIMDDGSIYGEAYKPQGKGYLKFRGFVNASGFTRHRITDVSHLYYRNITGQKIPTAIRYKGKQVGFIDKNEVVNAIAYVNGWMLTGKGWTKAEWLCKQRDIADYESMKTLVYAVITQTVKDYRRIIHKIRNGGRFSRHEFADPIAELRMIREWFNNGDYLKILEDDATGQERLEMLDKELGVREEWMKKVLSKKRNMKY